MKRLWLGVGILALFLILSLWCGVAMGGLHTDLADRMEEASQAALSGDMDNATSRAEQVKKDWEDHWRGTAALADHAPMDEIDGLFAQLTAYGQAGQAEDFAACGARLSRLLEAVGEAHVPVWWNLL